MSSARTRRGIASVELALFAPVLVLLLAGISDVVTYYRAQLRFETASAMVGQIVSQCTTITNQADVNEFFSYAQTIVGNLTNLSSTNGTGAIIISAMGVVTTNNVAAPRIRWQLRSGNPTRNSTFGTVNNVANLGAGNNTVGNGETIFGIEIYGSTQAYVLSQTIMGSLLGPLKGITLFASRATDATSLQNAPRADNTNRVCTL